MKRLHPARTPLFQLVQRAMRLAVEAERTQSEQLDGLLATRGDTTLDRRTFLRRSMQGAAVVGAGTLIAACKAAVPPVAPLPAPTTPTGTPTPPSVTQRLAKVAIVGGGVAGLNCAYKLKQAGVDAFVFEGAKRTGGRMFTAKDIMGPGLTTELGGEFIDSSHEEMMALAKEFGLELIDTQAGAELELARMALYFDGKRYTEADLVKELQAVLPKVLADQEALPESISYQEGKDAEELDKTSIAEYLDALKAPSWVRALLAVAYETEYGLPITEQSALNFLLLVAGETVDDKFELFGESDERYKIKGGNQRIVDELASRLTDRTSLGHILTTLKQENDHYVLGFATDAGPVEVRAMRVVLALPFSTLRNVQLALDLPPVKRKAIDELGYGTNAKLMLGFSQRLWRDQGYTGYYFTDLPIQTGWDNSQLQAGTAGGLTVYLGGALGVAVGQGTPAEQAAKVLKDVDTIYPGAQAAFANKAERMHWPTQPFTRGSYACYKVGQWTSIGGAEGEAVGNLFFAGEHCSADFQGYMNGGAETGKQAALDVVASMAVPAKAALKELQRL